MRKLWIREGSNEEDGNVKNSTIALPRPQQTLEGFLPNVLPLNSDERMIHIPDADQKDVFIGNFTENMHYEA